MEQKNCFHIHGGLSREMARRYPKAALADKATERGAFEKLGTYEIVDCGDIKVINAYGQYYIGGVEETSRTNYEAWEKIVAKLAWELPHGSVVKVPYKIGCGLGGGDFSVMHDIFFNKFGRTDAIDIKFCVRDLDRIDFEKFQKEKNI